MPVRTRATPNAWQAVSQKRSVKCSRLRCRADLRIATRDGLSGQHVRKRANRDWLLPARSLQPLVIFLALEAELVDQFRVGFETLRQVDGEQLRVDLRIVNRQLDLECPEVRPPNLLGHLRGVAHRAAPGVGPQIVAEASRFN